MNVSIVIICGKDRGYLRHAIASAEAQQFDGTFEIVVQQDASKSMPENTNEGVRRASGEYVKWLHDDDLLLPDALTSLWQVGEADVIVSNVEWFGDWFEESPKCYLPVNLEDFINNNPINQAGTMYRRQVLLDEPLNEDLWTAEEYELNLRLYAKKYTFKYIDAVTARYRVHPEMKSGSAYWYTHQVSKAKRKAEIERIRNIYREML